MPVIALSTMSGLSELSPCRTSASATTSLHVVRARRAVRDMTQRAVCVQIKRIGNYKSAGDQLLRRDMSEFQREQLAALLDDIFDTFVDGVASARGKTREDVIAMLDKGIYDMEEFSAGGWVTGLKYSDEMNEMMEERTGVALVQIQSVSVIVSTVSTT